MAAAGLAYALLTVKDRRAHDTAIASRPRRAPPAEPEPLSPLPAVTAPDKLAALTYLPSETGLILAAHVAELRDTPCGSKLVDEDIRVGTVDVRPEALARWTGLRIGVIDHLVVGARVDDSIPPRLCLIVHAKDPFNPAQLRAALHAQRVAGTGERAVYRYTAPDLSLPLYMICPTDRTAVVSLAAQLLDDVPNEPYADLSQLRPELRHMLRVRREVGAGVWLVAHVDSWPRIVVRPLLQGLNKDDLERIQQVRTLGVWVQVAGPSTIRVKADVCCKDTAAAASLEEFLRSPRRAANFTPKMARDGPWLSLQAITDLSALQKMLAAHQ
jgi:hypothetical protein